jgi:hypothetical protein
MMKIQVAAYCPSVEGAQELKYRGVVDDTPKIIEAFDIEIDILAEFSDREVTLKRD